MFDLSIVAGPPGLLCDRPGDGDLALLILHLGLQGSKDGQGRTSQQHLRTLSPVQRPLCTYTFILVLGGLIVAHVGYDYEGVTGAGAESG